MTSPSAPELAQLATQLLHFKAIANTITDEDARRAHALVAAHPPVHGAVAAPWLNPAWFDTALRSLRAGVDVPDEQPTLARELGRLRTHAHVDEGQTQVIVGDTQAGTCSPATLRPMGAEHETRGRPRKRIRMAAETTASSSLPPEPVPSTDSSPAAAGKRVKTSPRQRRSSARPLSVPPHSTAHAVPAEDTSSRPRCALPDVAGFLDEDVASLDVAGPAPGHRGRGRPRKDKGASLKTTVKPSNESGSITTAKDAATPLETIVPPSRVSCSVPTAHNSEALIKTTVPPPLVPDSTSTIVGATASPPQTESIRPRQGIRVSSGIAIYLPFEPGPLNQSSPAPATSPPHRAASPEPAALLPIEHESQDTTSQTVPSTSGPECWTRGRRRRQPTIPALPPLNRTWPPPPVAPTDSGPYDNRDHPAPTKPLTDAEKDSRLTSRKRARGSPGADKASASVPYANRRPLAQSPSRSRTTGLVNGRLQDEQGKTSCGTGRMATDAEEATSVPRSRGRPPKHARLGSGQSLSTPGQSASFEDDAPRADFALIQAPLTRSRSRARSKWPLHAQSVGPETFPTPLRDSTQRDYGTPIRTPLTGSRSRGRPKKRSPTALSGTQALVLQPLSSPEVQRDTVPSASVSQTIALEGPISPDDGDELGQVRLMRSRSRGRPKKQVLRVLSETRIAPTPLRNSTQKVDSTPMRLPPVVSRGHGRLATPRPVQSEPETAPPSLRVPRQQSIAIIAPDVSTPQKLLSASVQIPPTAARKRGRPPKRTSTQLEPKSAPTSPRIPDPRSVPLSGPVTSTQQERNGAPTQTQLTASGKRGRPRKHASRQPGPGTAPSLRVSDDEFRPLGFPETPAPQEHTSTSANTPTASRKRGRPPKRSPSQPRYRAASAFLPQNPTSPTAPAILHTDPRAPARDPGVNSAPSLTQLQGRPSKRKRASSAPTSDPAPDGGVVRSVRRGRRDMEDQEEEEEIEAPDEEKEDDKEDDDEGKEEGEKEEDVARDARYRTALRALERYAAPALRARLERARANLANMYAAWAAEDAAEEEGIGDE